MSSASELLNQYGVSVEDATSFIYANLASPDVIYAVAAQYGVTFDMLAELYGQGATEEVVKAFFEGQGMLAEGLAPYWDKGYTSGNYNQIYSENHSQDDTYWKSFLSDYRAKLAQVDWSQYQTSFEEVMNSIDWDGAVEAFASFALMYGDDTSWLDDMTAWLDDFSAASVNPDTSDGDIGWGDILPLSEWGVSENQFDALLSLTKTYVNPDNPSLDIDWDAYLSDALALLQSVSGNVAPELPMAVAPEPVEDAVIIGTVVVDDFVV